MGFSFISSQKDSHFERVSHDSSIEKHISLWPRQRRVIAWSVMKRSSSVPEIVMGCPAPSSSSAATAPSLRTRRGISSSQISLPGDLARPGTVSAMETSNSLWRAVSKCVYSAPSLALCYMYILPHLSPSTNPLFLLEETNVCLCGGVILWSLHLNVSMLQFAFVYMFMVICRHTKSPCRVCWQPLSSQSIALFFTLTNQNSYLQDLYTCICISFPSISVTAYIIHACIVNGEWGLHGDVALLSWGDCYNYIAVC